MQQTYGSCVRRIRQATGVSLRRAAIVASVTPSYLSRIETGQRIPPDIAIRARIAIAIAATKAEVARLEACVGVELAPEVRGGLPGDRREIAVIVVRGRRATRLIDSLLKDAAKSAKDREPTM